MAAMAASVQDPISKGIDSSVGGLVWVQRRNGRWWPGMIIGPDHLPQQPSSWPRSRTPVKLLGREDVIGSVDWYNIEKSKRVKAFRCGEYDEWITKANDSPKNSNKKAMKHVCRDDAIRHALKLEKTFISKKYEDFCSTNDHDHITESAKISPSAEPTVDDTIRIFDNNSNSTQELCVSGLSFEDPRQINSASVHLIHGNQQKLSTHFKEDEAEGTPRIGRVDSFCFGGVGDGDGLNIPKGGFLHSNLDMENSSSIQRNGGCTGDSPLFKRKRPAQVSVKRRNRHRPLTKVLESTNEVHVPVLFDITRSPNQSECTGLSGNNEAAIKSGRSKCSSVYISCNNLQKRKLVFNNEDLNGEIRVPETSHDSNHRLKDQNMSSSSKIQEEGPIGTLFDVPFAQKGDESDDTCMPFSDTLNVHPPGVEERECCGGTKSGTVMANWRPTGRRKLRRRQSTDVVTLVPHAYFVGADHWYDLSPSPPTSETLILPNHMRGSVWLCDVMVQVSAGPTPGPGPLTSLTSGVVKGEAVVGHGLPVEVVGSGGDERAEPEGCVRVCVVFERLLKYVGC